MEKIGSGGMADVYKAQDTALNRFVAVKILRPEYSQDETFVKKFRVEAQSAAGLSNPNVVGVYDVGEEDNTHFIVMELVEGITLKDYIEMKGKLDVKEALNISLQIALGLSAAHAKRIIHRDIKPQNIIMSRDGKVKVTDFGIAKMADSTTVTTTAAGTVHYISPEQARGGYSDEKSDIYSLGITMYEMLTGEVPFQGETNVAVALLHIQGDMTPPRELEPSIPVSFEKIILKCTQKKPDHRYQSARELIADLKKVLSQPDGAYVVMPGNTVPGGDTIIMNEEEMTSIKEGRKQQTAAAGPSEAEKKEPVRVQPKKKQRPQPEKDNFDEDEDNSSVGRIMMGLGILGFIILLIIIIYLVMNTSSLFGKRGTSETGETIPVAESSAIQPETETGEMKEVPDLKGKTYQEAKEILNGMGLGINQELGINDDYPEGQIYDQSVAPGEQVAAHTQVTVYVSSAKQTFMLSDVIGMNYEEAKSQLESRDLEVKLEFEKNDDVETDQVFKTDPEAGEQVAEGDTVTLYVCEGPVTEKASVPDVRGYDFDTAKQMMEEAGFKVGDKAEDYSDYYDEGTVMSQSLEAYTDAAKGADVILTISKGPASRTYVTYTTVPVDPFNPEGDADGSAEGAGQITVQITQDGKTFNAYDQYCTDRNRPFVLEITSTSDSPATATLYVDGEEVATWDFTF